jgi:hypothetical protein
MLVRPYNKLPHMNTNNASRVITGHGMRKYNILAMIAKILLDRLSIEWVSGSTLSSTASDAMLYMA